MEHQAYKAALFFDNLNIEDIATSNDKKIIKETKSQKHKSPNIVADFSNPRCFVLYDHNIYLNKTISRHNEEYWAKKYLHKISMKPKSP